MTVKTKNQQLLRDLFALLPLNKFGHSSTSCPVQVSLGMGDQPNNSMVPRLLILTTIGFQFIQGAPTKHLAYSKPHMLEVHMEM